MATHAPKKALGVLMTGMGEDGAQGLKTMRDAGCATIIQDKSTSVVWGMPGKAASLDAQDETLELAQIGPALSKLLKPLL